MFFVKMWLALIALTMVVSGLVGWAALVRGGCYLYTRYNVESARHFCAEVFGLLVGSTVVLMSMTEWPAFAKVVLQKNLNVASGCILITAVTVLELTLSYWLARFAFWAGKRWKFHVLQRQTLKQRVKCRIEGASACMQPQPCKCPIGIERPLGSINADEIAAIAQSAAGILQRMNQSWQDAESAGEEDPITPFVLTSVSFYPYYPERRVRVPMAIAKGFEAVNASFVSESTIAHDETDDSKTA